VAALVLAAETEEAAQADYEGHQAAADTAAALADEKKTVWAGQQQALRDAVAKVDEVAASLV
jgi:hypothetical protein